MPVPSKILTEAQAVDLGFVVDHNCYPWVGYKGPRFEPTETVRVYTTMEASLLEALSAASAHLDFCGYGDSYERKCAREDKLPTMINKAISDAESGGIK